MTDRYRIEKQYSATLAPREWPQIFRWSILFSTVVALIWVSRIRLDTAPGALLGSDDAVRVATVAATPRNTFAGNVTVRVPLRTLLSEDTIAIQLRTWLAESGSNLLRMPDPSLSARFPYAFNRIETNPPIRFLLGDDPVAAKLQLYADWIAASTDSISDPVDFGFRHEQFRGFMRFVNSLKVALNRDRKEYSPPRYSHLFAVAPWYEFGDTAVLRLSVPDSVPLSRISALHGAISGPRVDQERAKSKWLWYPLLIALPLMIAIFHSHRDDWKVYAAGAMAGGIWTLVVWEGLFSPFDSWLWLLMPIPFFAGTQLAGHIRQRAADAKANEQLLQWVQRWKAPFVLMIGIGIAAPLLIDIVLFRVLGVVAGLMFGMGVAAMWCLAEDALAKPWKPVIPRVTRNRWLPVVAILAVIPLMNLRDGTLSEWYQPVWNTASDEAALLDYPTLIGPLETMQDAPVTKLVAETTGEWYHPSYWELPLLSKELLRWFRTNPAYRTTQAVRTDEFTLSIRDQWVGAWQSVLTAWDTRFNWEKSNDSIWFRQWELVNRSDGAISHINAEIEELFSESFAKLERDLEDAADGLRLLTKQSYVRNPAVAGGAWYDQFGVTGGTTSILAFGPAETDWKSVSYRLPQAASIAGALPLRRQENRQLLPLLLVYLMITLLIGVGFRMFRALNFGIAGALLGAGVAAIFGVSTISILGGVVLGTAIWLACTSRAGVWIAGLLCACYPASVISLAGVILLLSSGFRWAGETRK